MLYTRNQVNLHTHSVYCGHGSGELQEYVDFAKEKGQLKVLGFSEHCPTPFKCYPSRMPYEKFPSYIKEVRELKKTTKDLHILLGAECDWDTDFIQFYKDELVAKEQFDYLIGSIHFMVDPEDGVRKYIGAIKDSKTLLKEYTKNYIALMESGLFLHACHPDLYTAGLPEWTEDAKRTSLDIIRAAKDLDLPLEVNGYGFRKPMIDTPNGPIYKYPRREFWELAMEEGIKICFNTDAHHVAHLEPEAGVQKFLDAANIKLVSWELQGDKLTAVKQ